MGPITQSMEVEQKQMSHSLFPLSKVAEDLEKELDLDFSDEDNAVHKKYLMPKKILVMQLKHKIVYQVFLTETETFLVQQKLKRETF